jgi:hypothetical protein
MGNDCDDFYNLNSSLRSNATHLIKEYGRLKHLIESCNKSSANLINSLNPLQSKISSLNSAVNKLIRANVKSFTNSITKEITGTTNSNFSGAIGQFLAKMIGGMRAGGGNVVAGTPYVVGEKGAEMFVPNQSGYIIPNNQLSGNNKQPINIVMNISTPDVSSFQRSQNQILAQATRAIQRASKNL